VAEKTEPEVRVVDRRWWARTDNEKDSSDAGLRKPTYVEELEKRVTDHAEQLQRYAAEHRKSLEEFEQAKLRIRRDVARDVERGKRSVLAELLDVVDNLDRAIAAAREREAADDSARIAASGRDSLLRGVELVRDQFLAKLAAFGVTRVDALGRPFDALKHEAVSVVPITEAEQDGVVVAVAREGYAIGDELLRPASVVVGQIREQS
jgi:molecular chaperone GrpE